MTHSENLPVPRKQPAAPQKRAPAYPLPPRYGNYAVSESGDDIALARLTKDERALLERRISVYGKKQGIITSVAMVVEQAGVYMPATPLEQLAVVVPAAAVGLNYLMVQPFRSLKLQRRQFAAANKALASENAVKLPNKFLGVHVPAAALEAEVTFLSEDDIVTQPAGKLIESIGLQAPGFHFETTDHSQGIKGEISPGRLVKQALTHVSESHRETFVTSVHKNLQDIQEASGLLMPVGLTATTPDSLRPSFEQPAVDLLTKSLAVYGTMRAFAGVRIAEQARQFYAQQQGSMAIIDDALRLEHATTNNVSWAEITSYQQHFE